MNHSQFSEETAIRTNVSLVVQCLEDFVHLEFWQQLNAVRTTERNKLKSRSE